MGRCGAVLAPPHCAGPLGYHGDHLGSAPSSKGTRGTSREAGDREMGGEVGKREIEEIRLQYKKQLCCDNHLASHLSPPPAKRAAAVSWGPLEEGWGRERSLQCLKACP